MKMLIWISVILGVSVKVTILKYLLRWWKRVSVKEKVVLVTGATSGLGEACAHVFHRCGAKLVLCGRNMDRLKAVQTQVKDSCRSDSLHGPKIVHMDLSQPLSIEQGVREVLSFYGRVDVLVNNAGVSSRSLAMDTGLDVDRYLMEVNYFGTVALTKALLPVMMKSGGHIVNVSSIQGKIGMPLRTSYSSSKHALQGFSDALRTEVSSHGIKVTTASPGYIRTNLSRNALQGDGSAHGVLDETTAKGMSPESVAMAILDAVQHGDRDVVIAGLSARIAVWLSFLWPSLLDWILLKRAGKALRHKQE